MNLELASHLVDGRAAEAITKAQTVGRLLLAFVREVVHTLGADRSIDLKGALATLANGSSQLGTPLEATSDPERLSRREVETLRLMAGGHSNREIGSAFGTTEGTVKNHVSSILGKLGVRSRTAAVLKGMELGYLGARRE